MPRPGERHHKAQRHERAGHNTRIRQRHRGSCFGTSMLQNFIIHAENGAGLNFTLSRIKSRSKRITSCPFI